MPGVGLIVRVVGLGSLNPEQKSHSAVELIPGGVDSACHPSEVGKTSASMLVSCVGVATHPGLYPIAKETALAAPTLCTQYGPNLLLLKTPFGPDIFHAMNKLWYIHGDERFGKNFIEIVCVVSENKL